MTLLVIIFTDGVPLFTQGAKLTELLKVSYYYRRKYKLLYLQTMGVNKMPLAKNKVIPSVKKHKVYWPAAFFKSKTSPALLCSPKVLLNVCLPVSASISLK